MEGKKYKMVDLTEKELGVIIRSRQGKSKTPKAKAGLFLAIFGMVLVLALFIVTPVLSAGVIVAAGIVPYMAGIILLLQDDKKIDAEVQRQVEEIKKQQGG